MTDQTHTGRPDTAAPAIELRGISKAFGPVQANKDISIRVMPGTIHGIIGENGAGKSTAMKAVFGMLNVRKGSVRLDGEDITDLTPQARVLKGIAR